MTHAFGLVIPAAQEEQGIVTAAWLRRHWTARSALLIYTDVSTLSASHEEHLARCATTLLRGPAREVPAVSLFQAMNALVAHAEQTGITCLTWLQPTNIPLYATTFYESVDAMLQSDTLLTYTPLSAKGGVPLLHGVHLRPRLLREAKFFPLPRDDWVAGWSDGDARVEFTRAMARCGWRWQERTTLLTAMTFAPTGARGVAPERTFRVCYYFPETSILVTDDSWFWSQYAQFVKE